MEKKKKDRPSRTGRIKLVKLEIDGPAPQPNLALEGVWCGP